MNKIYFRLFFQRMKEQSDKEVERWILNKILLYGQLEGNINSGIYWKFSDLYEIQGMISLREGLDFIRVRDSISQEWDIITDREAIWNNHSQSKNQPLLGSSIEWMHIENL